MDRIETGDRVVLLTGDGPTHVVEVDGSPRKVEGLGVFNPSHLLGEPWGRPVKVGQRRVVPLAPLPIDEMRTARRGPQIIQPKDAARILLECGVGPGTRVLEVGSGSGVLTLALAASVGKDGGVVSVDHRTDHQDLARSNVQAAGWSDRVRFVAGTAVDLPVAGPFDVAVLDIPTPQDAVPRLVEVLPPGAAVGVYVPTVRQVETIHGALDGPAWTQVRTLELIERSWHVGDRGSRPDHRMLGHTGFLTFARRGEPT